MRCFAAAGLVRFICRCLGTSSRKPWRPSGRHAALRPCRCPILPQSHPLSLGCSILQEASQQALADADVVLLVGSEVAAGDHFLPKLEISGDIIRIDIDPTELTSMYSAAVPIQADARAAMLALCSRLSSRKPAAQRSQGEM